MSQAKGTEGMDDTIVLVGGGGTGGMGVTRGTLGGTRALSLGMKREGRVLRHGWWGGGVKIPPI